MHNQTSVDSQLTAASLAGVAILLEIGAEYKVIDTLRNQGPISVSSAAKDSQLSESVIARYFDALTSAGLLERDTTDNSGHTYRGSQLLPKAIHDVGYISWGLRACQPLIENARKFATDGSVAQETYQRDGHLIARTSQWMGEQSFYPQAEQAILTLRPNRFVDLGCGSARLLIKILQQIPEATGVGVDMSAKACADARVAALRAGVADRLEIIESPIQALAADPTPLKNAEAIHAGFVFHDLMPNEEKTLDALLSACATASPKSTLFVVDAVPFAKADSERMFSAAFSYLHHGFMGRQLQSEVAWSERLAKAGFMNTEIQKLGIPGGRLFAAHNNR